MAAPELESLHSSILFILTSELFNKEEGQGMGNMEMLNE